MKSFIVILGAGESGVGSAVLALKKGHDVFVSDSGVIKDEYRKILNEYSVKFEEGSHNHDLILKADEVIKSPGIPDKAPIVAKLIASKIPVISEIEFASRYTSAKIISITGSNGKTTTTNLIYHILSKAGLNVVMAGNVGSSFAMSVATESPDYYVLELSSFQLDGVFKFRSDISVLMNITPDHLDRYDYKMDNYIRSKFRIIRNQRAEDTFIYWSEDPVIEEFLRTTETPVQKMPFSWEPNEASHAWTEDETLFIKYPNKTNLMTIHDLALKGKHNAYNSMAAAIAAKVLNIRKEVIRESLSEFQGVEHRLENVLSVHGINFINDSKATNVNSAWYALECMKGDVVWIAGGIDKGNDYSELFQVVRQKVRALVCLGKDNSKLLEAFGGKVPTIVEAYSMEEAVRSAYYLSKKGDSVLLSPACASFDLFKNYEDRGRQFKDAVRNL